MTDLLILFSVVSIWIAVFEAIVLTAGAIKFLIKQNRRPLVIPRMMDDYPTVTVMVPAHNEELVIAATVERILLLNYPSSRIQILIVADNCTDRTADKVENLLNKPAYSGRNLQVMRRTGTGGKSGALNDALKLTTGEWICVFDADAAPERNALAFLMQKAMEKPELYGAVFGRNKARNRNQNLLSRCINLELITMQRVHHIGLWELFKIGTIPGTNFIVRTELIREIGGWDEEALTEDTAISFDILSRGHLIALAPQAEAYQQEPEKLSVYMRQRERWAKGNYQVVMDNLHRLVGPSSWRIKLHVLYLAASYFWFMVAVLISDIVLTTNIVYRIIALFHPSSSSPFVFESNLYVFLMVAWALMYYIYVLQINLALASDIGQSTIGNFILSVISYFTYSQLFMIISVRAFYALVKDKVTGTKTRWYKTQRFG